MDFFLTSSASTFPCFQINWYSPGTKEDSLITVHSRLAYTSIL